MTKKSSNGVKGQRTKSNRSKKKPIKKARIQLHKLDSLSEIIQNRKAMDDHRKFNWQLYAELASQRNNIQDEIRVALLSSSVPYAVSGFQRAVKWKYGLHPLSTIGSFVDIGGRFNIGKQVNPEFAAFHALYLAEDKDTALQEHLGQEAGNKFSLTAREIALTNPQSEVIVSVSVNVDKIFDLTKLDNLRSFVNLIKNFKLSKQVHELAKKLQISTPMLVTTANLLRKSLLENDWRRASRLFDLPSNSQIFGQLLYSAGIEGIVYNSKFTDKKCIAIFLKNFKNTNSFVTLDDEPPHLDVPTRINADNWELSENSFDHIAKLTDN